MPRLFVAFRPSVLIRDSLHDLMEGVAGARWQDDDQLHLTLRFIGEVDHRTTDDIVLALRDVRADAVDAVIAGVGQFERRGRVDSLWARVAPREPLAALHKKVDHALVRLGLPPEGRAYLPHITIARLGRGAGPIEPFLATHAALATPVFAVDHIALFESVLGSGGATYEKIARVALRA